LLRDLILNFAILSVYLFLVFPLAVPKDQVHKSSLLYRLKVGGVFGILGVILLFFSINVHNNTPLNLRGIAIMLAAFFGGPVAALTELGIVYIGRFIKDGSLNYVQTAIGITAAWGTGLVYRKINHYWIKWAAGPVFLLVYYYFGLWFAGQIELRTVGFYLVYQACYALLIACFLYYLLRNRQYKDKIAQVEQGMLFMLRMQPGFTFRFQKRSGQFIFTLVEGQLLKKWNKEPSELNGKDLEQVLGCSEELAAYHSSRFEQAWQGEVVSYEAAIEGTAKRRGMRCYRQRGGYYGCSKTQGSRRIEPGQEPLFGANEP
jgi:two-component system sensor histidine kinase/response regulator